MAQEFIIGRAASSPVKVPAAKVAVSGSHAKITIHDNGEWELEDLKSGNGTYIKDENGDFQRVHKKKISEHTVIRLGAEGHSSFAFMAHRAVAADDADYSYEFQRMRRLLKEQIEAEAEMEERNGRNMKIVKISSPLAMVLCILVQYAIPGMEEKHGLNLWLSRISMSLTPIIVGFFFGIDTKGMKSLKQRRVKVLTCPHCGYPLSEFDIQNMQCSRCKSK